MLPSVGDFWNAWCVLTKEELFNHLAIMIGTAGDKMKFLTLSVLMSMFFYSPSKVPRSEYIFAKHLLNKQFGIFLSYFFILNNFCGIDCVSWVYNFIAYL